MILSHPSRARAYSAGAPAARTSLRRRTLSDRPDRRRELAATGGRAVGCRRNGAAPGGPRVNTFKLPGRRRLEGGGGPEAPHAGARSGHRSDPSRPGRDSEQKRSGKCRPRRRRLRGVVVDRRQQSVRSPSLSCPTPHSRSACRPACGGPGSCDSDQTNRGQPGRAARKPRSPLAYTLCGEPCESFESSEPSHLFHPSHPIHPSHPSRDSDPVQSGRLTRK